MEIKLNCPKCKHQMETSVDINVIAIAKAHELLSLAIKKNPKDFKYDGKEHNFCTSCGFCVECKACKCCKAKNSEVEE